MSAAVLAKVRWTAVAALSGGATLAAEVLGARLLRPLLGSTAAAQSGSVAGVLGGLGLGAFFTARLLSAGKLSPTRALGMSHLALAVIALAATPLSLALSTPMARALVAVASASPALGDVARWTLALALTAVPGALAGVLYPSVVRLLDRDAGTATAWVGAASSVGAGLACVAVTFGIAPAVGIGGAMTAVAAVYALIGGAALRAPSSVSLSTVTEGRGSPSTPGASIDLPALALVGFASTAWQVALTRVGVLSFGPSAYALAAVLAGHVLALALGEAVALRSIARAVRSPDDAPARSRLGRVCLWGAALALGATPLALKLPWAVEQQLREGMPSLATWWSTALAGVMLLAVPVVGTVGAAMAWGARWAAEGRDPGAANGRVLLATGAGNVLGALGATGVLLPFARIEGALVAAGAALCAAGLIALRPSRSWAVAGAVLFALGASSVLRSAREDPAAVLNGPYLYARATELDLGTVLWRRDGREATVAVRRDPVGALVLQIDGKVDATSLGDATTQTVVGVVPTLMARSPRRAFVIGLGSGMTADAVRVVPGVESVTVAELVPEVVRAAREDFAGANHRVLSDRRVRALAVDAAHHLRGTRDTYDVIVSEPSNPWVAGMSDLFTREVFSAARARLSPGGVMGAWFHAYSTDADTVGMVVETFRSVFPRSALMEVGAGRDYLLVGVAGDGGIDLDAMMSRASSPAVAELLRAAGIDSNAALLARFLSGSAGVAAVGRGAEVHTASSLVLEFRAPGLLYRDATAEVFARLARIDDLPLAGLVRDSGPGSRWLRLLDESEGLREAGTHARAMALAEHAGNLGVALREGEIAVALRPGDLLLRTMVARLYLTRALLRRRARDRGGAEQDYTSVLELRPHASERFRALLALGDMALRRRDGRRAWGRYTEAMAIAETAEHPASELHVRLAESLAVMGQSEDAARELDTAIRLTDDPRRRRQLEALRRR